MRFFISTELPIFIQICRVKHFLKILFSVFIAFVAFSCQSEKQENVNEAARRMEIVDSTVIAFHQLLFQQQLDTIFAKSRLNGGISVAKQERIINEKFNGFEGFKTKSKIDSNSVFAIGSVSKQFTAVLVLLQEEAGKLSIDDKVSKYLSDFQSKPFQEITIAQLLTHTSGISDAASGLLSVPGTKFNYSNKGYRFLGEIVAKVSGQSLDQNLQTLFKKVKMIHSSTANLSSNGHFASAYLGTPTVFQQVQNMPKRLASQDISVAAGGVLSSLSDLHRWNFALYNGQILGKGSLKKMLTPSSQTQHTILGKVGYGLGIMMNVGKPVSYFHTGYVKGSPSLNIYYPQSKTSVVILSNIADESKGKNTIFAPHKAVKEVADAIENATSEMHKAMKVQ